MNNAKHYLLFLLILTSVISCNLPGDPFKRPKIAPTIANGDGNGYQNGELVDTTNMICVSPNQYDILQEYWDDKEYRLLICLRYQGRCK